jgi:hypothetical protein
MDKVNVFSFSRLEDEEGDFLKKEKAIDLTNMEGKNFQIEKF